jgi:hypothetical protein
MNLKLLVILTLNLFLLFSVFAAEITLKSGEVIKGKIVDETDEYIKLDFYGSQMTYYKDQIRDIRRAQNRQETKESQAKTQQKQKKNPQLATFIKRVDYQMKNMLEMLQRKRNEIKQLREDDHQQEVFVVAEDIVEQIKKIEADLQQWKIPPEGERVYELFKECLEINRDIYEKFSKGQMESSFKRREDFMKAVNRLYVEMGHLAKKEDVSLNF